MTDYECHYWFNRFLHQVIVAEQNLKNKCRCTIGSGKNAKEWTEKMSEMFVKDGYQVSTRVEDFPEGEGPLYSLIVKCRYETRHDRLNQEMYALLDTRTGKLVKFEHREHSEYAIFATPEAAKGAYGLLSDEVLNDLGKEYIKVITLKMDKVIE